MVSQCIIHNQNFGFGANLYILLFSLYLLLFICFVACTYMTIVYYNFLTVVWNVNVMLKVTHMSSPNAMKGHRCKLDVIKLIERLPETTVSDNMRYLIVLFHGPPDTAYANGVWRVHVHLPDNYPFKSPSIGFEGRSIFHPNIDFESGSICLDVINQKWSALYDLNTIFETFLPQLLRYPNATDPLNKVAASMFLQDTSKFDEFVTKEIERYRQRHDNAKVTLAADDNVKSNNDDNNDYSELSDDSDGATN